MTNCDKLALLALLQCSLTESSACTLSPYPVAVAPHISNFLQQLHDTLLLGFQELARCCASSSCWYSSHQLYVVCVHVVLNLVMLHNLLSKAYKFIMISSVENQCLPMWHALCIPVTWCWRIR